MPPAYSSGANHASDPNLREHYAALTLELCGDQLAGIASTLQFSLHASAVAIALESEGGFVCRAAAGSPAPEVGSRVTSEDGITGECISRGTEIVCPDTQADARVNAAACRQLGIRSVLLVPLLSAGKVVGVVEAMSAYPNAFDQATVSLLQSAAHDIVSLVREPAASTADEMSAAATLKLRGTAESVALFSDDKTVEAIRAILAAAVDASDQGLPDEPFPSSAQASSASVTAQTSDATRPRAADNTPKFFVQNSFISVDWAAEFLSRGYSVFLAVAIACLLLLLLAFAIKQHASRPAAPTRRPVASYETSKLRSYFAWEPSGRNSTPTADSPAFRRTVPRI